MGLAGQHVTAAISSGSSAIVLLHLHRALEQLRPAGAADPALARVGRVRAHPQRGVEDRLAVAREREARSTRPSRMTVTLLRPVGGRRGLAPPCGCGGGAPTWNSSVWMRPCRRRSSTSTPGRPATISNGPQRNHSSTSSGGTSVSRIRASLARVDPAGQQVGTPAVSRDEHVEARRTGPGSGSSGPRSSSRNMMVAGRPVAVDQRGRGCCGSTSSAVARMRQDRA